MQIENDFSMKLVLIGMTLLLLMILPALHASDSSLYYKLIVTVKPEQTPIDVNGYPVIVGKVVDEASKPIANAQVKLSFEKQVVVTTTDSNGNFRYKSGIPAIPGNYLINVAASKDGYVAGYASSSYFVNQPPKPTLHKSTNLLPVQTGNYTMFLGKVTEWNLETTCFVKFGNEYKRFLKSCDLYSLAPDDFKTEDKVVSVVTVIKHDGDYRLFPASTYYNAIGLDNKTTTQFVIGTWKNYTAPH